MAELSQDEKLALVVRVEVARIRFEDTLARTARAECAAAVKEMDDAQAALIAVCEPAGSATIREWLGCSNAGLADAVENALHEAEI